MSDVLYNGHIAYARVDSNNSLIKKMIKDYEYPAYSHHIIFGKSDEKTAKKYANTYWQRVPVLDKNQEIVALSK